MARIVTHDYIDDRSRVSVVRSGSDFRAQFFYTGSFSIRHPGKLSIVATGVYSVQTRVGDLGTDGAGSHQPRWATELKTLDLRVEIRMPNGELFTRDRVTLHDIWRFRDVRGTSVGSWTITVRGSAQIPTDPDGPEVKVSGKDAHVSVSLAEALVSESAPPLVEDGVPGDTARVYEFDLYRVGTFEASAVGIHAPIALAARRRMSLIDPDGVTVASSDDGRLHCAVTLATLGKSRDHDGNVRLWKLEVLPAAPLAVGQWLIEATVIAAARIRTDLLESRLNALLGPHGSFLSIYGETRESGLLVRLNINDEHSAETIGMHKLLRSTLKKVEQDPDVDIQNIDKDVAYTLHRFPRDFGEFHVSLYGMRVSTIDIALGLSEHIHPPVPAIRIAVGVEGHATLKLGGFPLAEARVRDGRVRMEAGVRLRGGRFVPEIWIEDDRVDLDVHWALAVASGLVSLGLLTLGEVGFVEMVEEAANLVIPSLVNAVLLDALSKLPDIPHMLQGGEFNYRAVRFDGSHLVFEYVAPLEPEPKRNPEYVGIVGRSAVQVGPQEWDIHPRSVGDTWSIENLQKIDHIVVVMMENRSFDHVLGYRPEADGLSPELIEELHATNADHVVRELRLSSITPNALGLKTRFPMSVGHHLADVTEQLAERMTLSSGRSIVSPAGFLSNFGRRPQGALQVSDVLGYYVGEDLPFYRFLAENYAYCDRYFSSHPGPTLPNRMLALSGDIQFDRTGEAIVDDNNGDNFILSRAPSIFDLLTRKGVRWRVYESAPSLAMLRMFARYVGDNENIVPVSQFPLDVGSGGLPSVVVIEPAMHHSPENDDHPIADMYRGQRFLRGIYETLRESREVWRRTLLIVTYDEHGGFYDHVIPPVAEARSRPMLVSDGDTSTDNPVTPPTLVTSYGARVPAFVVSPWVPPGKGPEIVLDHCSILKTILARFCGDDRPFLSDRVRVSRSFESYLSAPEPRFDVPSSPVIEELPPDHMPRRRSNHSQIETNLVSSRSLRNGTVEAPELMGMLARMKGR